MSDEAGAPRRLALSAAACATVVLASQLCGKAARDAIFLQRFEVSNLPLLTGISSALAIVTTLIFARRLSRGVPLRVVQAANLVSAVLLVGEWAMLEPFPRATATIVYMHQMLIGPILVSGFWSIVSECFDPRSARKMLGIVGGGATIGAIVGALIAERVAALLGTNQLLLAVAALQLMATWGLHAMVKGAGRPLSVDDADGDGKLDDPLPVLDAVHKITSVSLLRRLASIVVIVTVSAAMCDFVFKSVASGEARRDDLTRLFALFHGAVGVMTAVVQWTVGRWALSKLGLARTLAALPGAVIGFGVAALIAPGVGTFVLLRGAENVLRNSLYREAYEVFYTPLLPAERRATKTVVDVGVERLGDVIGSLIVIAVLAIVGTPTPVLLGIAVALSVVGVLVALKAKQSYVEALERSLVAHSIELRDDDRTDHTTRSTMEMLALRQTAGLSGTMTAMRQTDMAASASGRLPLFGKKRRAAIAQRGAVDPTLARLIEIVSGEPARIRGALLGELLSPAAVAYAIPLLGRADVGAAATKALSKVAGACLGQLVDAVRDPLVPLTARTQLPTLIAAAVLEQGRPPEDMRARSELARSGLTASLADGEFEVRFRAASALAELRERVPELQVDAAAVFDGVRRELAVDPAVWKALDDATVAAQDAAATHPGPRALSRAAQHLATLLTLALPAEPVRTAFHSLWSDDKTIRGVALEYLDNVLPDDVRERMWLVLALEAEAAAESAPAADADADADADEAADPGVAIRAIRASAGAATAAAEPLPASIASVSLPRPPTRMKRPKRPIEDVLAELLRPRPARPAPPVDEMRGTQIDLPKR